MNDHDINAPVMRGIGSSRPSGSAEAECSMGSVSIARRLKDWQPSPCKEKRGVLAKYAKQVKSASEGAITDGD